MRTIICVVLLLQAIFCMAQSEIYKSIEGGLFLGGVSSNDQAGISSGIETRYNLTDRFSLGLTLETIGLVNKDEINETAEDIENGLSLSSFAINSDYYLRNGKHRFFAGLEVGIYKARNIHVDSRVKTTLGKTVGFAPRIGARLGWFRPVLKYHFVPKIGDLKLSSLDMTVGITFGGKKK